MFRKSISVLLTVCILLTVILPVVQAEEWDGMSDAARAEAYLSNLDAENSALEEEEPPKKAAGITLAEMTARAEAIVNYAWTPSQNITTWNSNKYNGLTYFPAGQTVKGMPYTLFTSEVVSQSLCSLERYKTLASSNYSATKYCNSVGATRTGPVYGSCCADLVCEVFGGNFMSGSSPRYHSVTYIKNSSYGTTTSNVPISQLRPGDAVSDTAVTHILWIGAVTDTQITFYEQTPPIARKVTVNKASCTNSNGYFVYGGHVYNIVTRSKEYVETDYLNSGEDFYAFIIKFSDDLWKHTEAKDQNVQIASNGNDSSDPKQIWHFIRQIDGTYKIENEYQGYCLDAVNFGTANGTNVGAGTDNGSSAQRWYIVPCGSGYGFVPSYCTNIAMGTDGSDNIALYTRNESDSQLFTIYKLTLDGVTYSKPAKPNISNVTSVSYVGNSDFTIKWNDSPLNGRFDKRQYDIRIWRGENATGTPYITKYGLKNPEYTVALPKGTYTIQVVAVNVKYYEYYTVSTYYTAKLDPCESGHTYECSVTQLPTTSATGVLTGTCSKCSGTTTVTLPKLNTTDYTKTTTKSATCTEGGTDSYKWKTTTYGTFTFTVATSAKGHTSVTDKAVAATCTATGLTEGSHCSVCNAVIKAQTTVAALGHSYTSKVTAPTCTAQGYTTYTCSRCSNSYKDSYTNATGHSYTYKATTNPTTSATGVLTGTCSKCSGTTTVTLPKLNTTDYTKTTTKSATCTEGGTDSYKWKTTTYGTFTFTVATSAKGHTSVTDKAVAATCTATGLTEGSHCSVCNAVIKAQTTVAALGHSYTSKVTAPTCTAQGYTTYTCSRCSNSYKDSYTNATGHSYTYKATTNPTTSATGVLTGTCSKCSGTTTVTLPKLNTTDYTKTSTKSATCTEGGTDSYKWKTTTYGTFTFTVATSAKGHTSVTDKAVAATCTATGLTEGSHCSVCNAVIKAQTTVAALGHSYTSKVTAPTCTAQGYTTYTCSRCSNSYKDSYTNATGHSYTYKATTNPTTSATGVLTGTCSKCSGTTTVTLPKLNTTDYTKTTTKSATCTEGGTDSYKWKTTTYGTFTFTVATSAKGHTSVTDKAVAATCTATGLTEGSHCSVCNAVIKAQTTVAALGHSYTSKVTAPTCTAQGYTTYTCSRCADSYKDTYTDAIGHNYTYTDCGETHEGVCENCSNKVTESHNYSDGNCICGAIEITAPITDTVITISHSLNLASDISINYAVKASLLTNYDSFYLEVQRPVYSGNAMTGFKTIKIDPVLTGNYYYFTMTDITAVNMNDELVAILHMTKGKQEYISKTDSYSIVTYALNQLNKDTAADKLKTLCADLLRYGAAAQNFKGYRTDAGATVPMTDANRAWFSDINAVTFGNTNMVHNDLTNPLITWAGKTLNLESKVVVKFIFNAGAYTGNISNLTLRMVYRDNSGIYRTVTLTDPAVYNEAKRQYAFEFDGLLAAELRTALSVAVYSGDVQLSPTLQYSPDTYGNNKTGNLGELCKALFAYSDSAKAYFS